MYERREFITLSLSSSRSPSTASIVQGLPRSSSSIGEFISLRMSSPIAWFGFDDFPAFKVSSKPPGADISSSFLDGESLVGFGNDSTGFRDGGTFCCSKIGRGGIGDGSVGIEK